MARKKKKPGERTKPFQMLLHPLLREQLELLAERNFTTLSAEVTAAIRKHLEANDLWPPKPDGGK